MKTTKQKKIILRNTKKTKTNKPTKKIKEKNNKKISEKPKEKFTEKNSEKPKKLLIISSKQYKKATINAMLEESKKLFDSVFLVPINKLSIECEQGKVKLCYKGKTLEDFDVCYPRLSANDFLLSEAVLKAIENMNMYVPVSLYSYQVCNNKYYTEQVLANNKVPTVISTLLISPNAIDDALKETGFPVVVKLLNGFAGKGVMLVENKKQLTAILDTVHLFEDFVSTQKFIKGKNSDIRCYVIGKKVITVKRYGKKGEWRANVSRGGTAEEIESTPELKNIALNSARALGMDICAVDVMETHNGYVVIEVNFMPGPFMKFLDRKIIKEWIQYLYKRASP